MHEINKEFINYLRLNTVTTNWVFNENEKNVIVPEELTHDYLLRNFNIDESINRYYHLPTNLFMSDSEFQKMKDTGFIGEKETALKPYSNVIYGAYYSRSDLHTKLAGLVYSNRDYTIGGHKIKYFDDLTPYFKEYAKGFENGFNEFDNSQIKPFLTMFPDKQDYVHKVFEFVTKQIFLTHSWATLQTGFTINIKNQNNEIINAYENGQEQGFYYKAWTIIFSNNSLFTPLFQEHSKTSIQPNKKQNPELFDKQISFSSPDIIEKLHAELKGYFSNKERELLRVLQGEALTEKLLFPHNQNKFVELFKRVKYNGYLLNSSTEIRDWICSNFCFRYKRGMVEETRDFNQDSVWDILTKDKDPAKNERICIVEWLPYKSHLTRQREIEKEKL